MWIRLIRNTGFMCQHMPSALELDNHEFEVYGWKDYKTWVGFNFGNTRFWQQANIKMTDKYMPASVKGLIIKT
jgi:hypothetical protein